jgi:hypothetical protein
MNLVGVEAWEEGEGAALCERVEWEVGLLGIGKWI